MVSLKKHSWHNWFIVGKQKPLADRLKHYYDHCISIRIGFKHAFQFRLKDRPAVFAYESALLSVKHRIFSSMGHYYYLVLMWLTYDDTLMNHSIMSW